MRVQEIESTCALRRQKAYLGGQLIDWAIPALDLLCPFSSQTNCLCFLLPFLTVFLKTPTIPSSWGCGGQSLFISIQFGFHPYRPVKLFTIRLEIISSLSNTRMYFQAFSCQSSQPLLLGSSLGPMASGSSGTFFSSLTISSNSLLLVLPFCLSHKHWVFPLIFIFFPSTWPS